MQERDAVLMVAGEASADLHGAKVVRALLRNHADIDVFGMAGEAMRGAGCEALVPAERMSIAGLTEVLLALPRIFRIMRTLQRAAAARRPKVAVLIDMPDFNLRLAKRLKRLGIPVIYYISPQLWAWRPGRVEQIRQRVDQMLVILPFEAQWYATRGVPARFVGHPLVEELEHVPSRSQARTELGLAAGPGPVVALLPGSRSKELSRHLPRMLGAVERLRGEFPQLQAVLPVASTLPIERVERMVAKLGAQIHVIRGHSTEVLSAADAAVVCSGTATLQTALLARPMVVVYRASWLTYLILKRLVHVAHIGLVNLVAGKRLVPELIQNAFTPANVARELQRLLTDSARRVELEAEFARLRQQLGPGERASGQQVAAAISAYLPTGSDTRAPAEAPDHG